MASSPRLQRRFRRFGIATIVLTYLVILAGGVVRTTGSGMGCPDWPKCFGQWVPPTNAAALPDNYQEIFLEKRLQKSERLADMLQNMGFSSLAAQIRTDPSVKKEAPFNAVQTWIEYVNRLLGVLTGLFVIGTAVASFAFWRSDRPVAYWAIGALVAVAFQGWIGSLVVATNLMPWMVTVHMLLALGLVGMLIYVIGRSFRGQLPFLHPKPSQLALLNRVLLAGMALFVGQLVLGTQVREEVDVVAAAFQYLQREQWIDSLGAVFYVHRSYSLLLLAVHAYWWFLLRRTPEANKSLQLWVYALLAALLLETASGAAMAYFAIPKALQPVHLLLATAIFGLQCWIGLRLNFERWFPSAPATEGRGDHRMALDAL